MGVVVVIVCLSGAVLSWMCLSLSLSPPLMVATTCFAWAGFGSPKFQQVLALFVYGNDAGRNIVFRIRLLL